VRAIENLGRFLEVDPVLFDISPLFIVIPFKTFIFHGLTLLLSFRRCAVSKLLVMKSLLGKS
jgi:hypothetical protein